ncbi:hypothetical protein ACOSQ3_030838 [Xanthoceras sorbifolium]
MSPLITMRKKLPNPKKACKRLISLLHSKLRFFYHTRRSNLVTHHHHYRYCFHDRPPQKQQAAGQNSVYVSYLFTEPVQVEEHQYVCNKEFMMERSDDDDDYHQDRDLDGDDRNDDDDDDGVGMQMHEVDAKAEDFIEKFKQFLRLESQKSVEEYYAMLARGT